jgi:AmmeMemoRadiSam system protein B
MFHFTGFFPHRIVLSLFVIFAVLLLPGCGKKSQKNTPQTVRGLVDTVGFAHEAWQMDSLMARIRRLEGDTLTPHEGGAPWRVCISPHDDYTYVGYLYPAVLNRVKTPLVILFGVAHKARLLHLQDHLVIGTYRAYHGPWGNIPVTPLREEIFSLLDTSLYTVDDSMMTIEHSLEALLPFLQYYNRQVTILPVLVPYMSYDQMDRAATALAGAIHKVTTRHNMVWGKDYSLVISTDAVHYGDEKWGGKNYAPYGTDSAGLVQAVAHEHEIIESTLTGPLTPARIKRFTEYTVQPDDYKAYKWTWCGRYSVPEGLLTAWHLQQITNTPPLTGVLVGYRNSIDHTPIPVKDLNMGVTAPAYNHHWVGYAAVGYE